MAASKCRQRKLERITELEALLQNEKSKSLQLEGHVDMLRAQVDGLTKHVEQHVQSGCRLELPAWYRHPPGKHDLNL